VPSIAPTIPSIPAEAWKDSAMRWRYSIFGQNIISGEISFNAVTTRIKIADSVDFPKSKRLPTDV